MMRFEQYGMEEWELLEEEAARDWWSDPDDDEDEHVPTRGERRAAQHERERVGMVRHSAPNVRPMRLPKPNVRVKS